MSLARYINEETIKVLNSPQYGQIFEEQDLKNLITEIMVPTISSLQSNTGTLLPELHIYTFNGDYVGSIYDNKLILERDSNSLLIDVRQVFKVANIRRGSYKIVFNLMAPIFGRPGSESTSANWPIFAREISPDRTEVKLTITDTSQSTALQQFREYVNILAKNDILNNLVINFGNNQVYKVLKIRFDKNDQNVFYLKLYKPINPEVEDLAKAFMAVEAMDPYIDTVILTEKVAESPGTQLKGPNFDIDVDDWQSQATIFQSWNDLLDTNATTAQRIVDGVISGSGQATLNIDYTDFNNFVFYSSAEERVENFVYKMKLIESYSVDNSNLVASSGSGSEFVSSNYNVNLNRIDNLLTGFDPFERWLYYHDTGSIFTHGISGSITPWPKYMSGSMMYNHHVTSSLAVDWYSSSVAEAQVYDKQNVNSLWWSIPEHVLMDPNNDQYVTFVNMVGQHFDVMYSYVHALTQIHNKDEHPERGPSGDLLYHIAKSFGWNLQNTRQLSSLWLYKLGTDELGQHLTSSNMDVLPHEEQTRQIWRRIVNNLPYLLKTKGTSRSIKALMSIYGIPQTLISIKEYGGPGIDSEKPILIEDTFAYALNVDSGSYIKIPQDEVTARWYGWGNGRWCAVSGSGVEVTRTPDTYEFRFDTRISGTLGAQPLFTMTSGSSQDVVAALSLVSSYELEGSASISGSEHYGKILFETFGATPQYEYSDWLPIFDDDFWTIRIYNEEPISGSNIHNRIHIARASDSLYGRIAQESVVSMSADAYTVDTVWLAGGSGSAFLQANTATTHTFTGSAFSGSLQGYKEYYTLYDNDTFYNHVLNPRAYHTSTATGSFYSLYRYIPFGLDLQREDRTINTFESSSHPDQDGQTPTLHEYVNFVGDQQSQYEIVNETFYSEAPIIGGNTLRGEKIRIEDSELKFQLDPVLRAERSEYDQKPTDTNRLAIVFSLADQINRDIINHTGYEDLDGWIGDPEEQFNEHYQSLLINSNEYFRKYQQYNDINSFIRILSLYDYTFFEQIKQLTPGRADLIAGILLEPHILQRPKVVLQKRPTTRNPQWEDTIRYIPSQSGKFPSYKTEFEIPKEVDIEWDYNSGSINLAYDHDMEWFYESGSIGNPFFISGSECVYKSGSIEVIDGFTGVTSSRTQVINTPRPDCRYKKKECQYDAFLIKDSIVSNSRLDTTELWYTSSFVQTVSESLNLSNVNTIPFKYGQAIDINEYISQSFGTISGSEYFVRIYARPFDTGSNAGKINIILNGVEKETQRVFYRKSGSMEWVNEQRFRFTGSGNDELQVKAEGTKLVIYTVEVYKYVTKWVEQWIEQTYRQYRIARNCVYTPWHYQIDECSARNRSRFVGSKLEGPGINIDSPNTIDGGPVVRITKTNPNSISTNNGGSEGNLRLE